MRPVEEILSIYRVALPEGWKWFTVHFAFGDGRTKHFTEYGISEDRSIVKKDFSNKVEGEWQWLEALRDTVAPPPMEQPTHIELTIQHTGKFETVLGYGEVNWDPAPRGWPDDIRAEDYTYTKAWPNGLKEQTKKRLKDPRSLIGYD